MIIGEPMVGIRTNGTTRLPTMAPVVLTASSDPDSPPAELASSRSSSDAAGKAMPRTIVTGSTTISADRSSASQRRDGACSGSSASRPTEHEHEPEQREARRRGSG